jgi:hypothetical protein
MIMLPNLGVSLSLSTLGVDRFNAKVGSRGVEEAFSGCGCMLPKAPQPTSDDKRETTDSYTIFLSSSLSQRARLPPKGPNRVLEIFMVRASRRKRPEPYFVVQSL